MTYNLIKLRRHSVLLLIYISLLIAAAVVLAPIYIVFVNAFKSMQEYALSGVFALPESFTNFDNLKTVLERGKFVNAFKNTGIIITASVAGNVILGTMAAYAIGRFKFKLRPIILGLYASAVLIPAVTTQVATYSLINDLGLINTHFAPILLYLGVDIVQLYLYLQFIRNIPYDLDESAMIEGASLITIFRKIIVPLLQPAIATVVILKSIGIYNDMYTPYLYMPSPQMNVVSTVLMRFSTVQQSQWTLICMAIMIIVIPSIIFFLVLQRYIFAGIASGAVK